MRQGLYVHIPNSGTENNNLKQIVDSIMHPPLDRLNRKTNLVTLDTVWVVGKAGKERFDSTGKKLRHTLLKDDPLYLYGVQFGMASAILEWLANPEAAEKMDFAAELFDKELWKVE